MSVDWDLLVRRIRNGMCVPFLGAAANVTSKPLRYRGTRLGRAVSRKIAARLSPCPPDTENLARVALQYEVVKDRPDLDVLVRRLIDRPSVKPSPLLETLAQLPFRLIVTTNYDRLMETALEKQNKDHRILVQPPDGFSPKSKALEELAGYYGTIVYKIHGTFPEDPNSSEPTILTEEDYIKFLTTVTKGDVVTQQGDRIGVPNLITARLASSSLLFLGYGLEDWDFRVLHNGMVQGLPSHKRFKSYAVQWKPNKNWVQYWQSKNVVIYDMDVYDFARQLLQQYTSKLPLPNSSSRVSQPPANPPNA